MSKLTFLQISSSVNPSFWNKLSELKLNIYKLDESSKHIWGFYTVPNNSSLTFVEVDSTSFNREFNYSIQNIPFYGKLYNKNSVEEFKECDKVLILNKEGRNLYEMMKNKTILENPSHLNCFIILSFADLKKYIYYYWFAFPVPKGMDIEIICLNKVTELFSRDQVDIIYQKYMELECTQRSHCILTTTQSSVEIHTLAAKADFMTLENINEVYFVFYNVSYECDKAGSQLRNYVAFILHTWPLLQNQEINFLALNLSRQDSRLGFWNSFIYKLKVPIIQEQLFDTWIGWEPNDGGKMGPRVANMRNSLDPLSIAEDAVDLNLKLMKWNVLPNVNLDIIRKSKFLLLGSGTLGCSVSRVLLGWGARNITFVDNSNVSFSNPVRQSLFTFEDSVKMRPKAEAAAESLRLIFPGSNSQGIQLNVNMPGHSVGESLMEQTIQNVTELTNLIKNHDVIFILMDSRESRWLPTLLGNYYKKVVINAALGFDSYLVMRHGIMMEDSVPNVTQSHPEGFKSIHGGGLGCYFCNDVRAPGNSLKGRTLDQQCTVTRPGVSQIAGALAAELAVSILQHKNGIHASAFYGVTDSRSWDDSKLDGSVLGLIPHSIRGFLHTFEQIFPATEKYTNCVACSRMVLNEYQQHGINFLLKVFNSSKHLEDIALLTEMFKETNFSEVLEFSDEDF